ncbi:MAG TPA: hypothetical protein VK789_24760 [Bryobacteraceae bacterium]|nr:hypothetical protein [Bryobacteraceae bacterium]
MSRRLVPAILAILLGLTSTSCLFTRRVILRHNKKVAPGAAAPVLLKATRDELNMRLANIYNAINSFQAKVQLTPSVGSVYTGQITEIHDVTAFVLFRKPADIRIGGNTPVIGTRLFDMVSNGNEFKLQLYEKSLFIIGSNDAPPTSKSKLENLRPEAFLSSMLIRPADPQTEFPMIEDFTDEDNAFYILNFARRAADGSLILSRTVWFDRVEDLNIVRQMVFDPSGSGDKVSDTRYAKWQSFNGVMFPTNIDINRPLDGYGLVLEILDPKDPKEMKMNTELTDDKFVLNQPEGYKVQTIGAPK